MDCENLSLITYDGSMIEWQSIYLGENWKNTNSNVTIACSDGTITL